ncbi:MAG: group II intron reverse transcriptase/maturase [Pseudomonadota bacterium]
MAVHSNDGLAWLTKLERIGELSARTPNIIFNNIGYILSAEMLKQQFHQLDGNKAVGIDKVTKAYYGEKLDGNLQSLIKRIRRGTYRPQVVRLTEIPKEDGSKRPLAISCFEDKLVQLAVSAILNKIYEPLFLPSSYGFRPNRNCHDALKALTKATYQYPTGAVVEIDIRKYFNTIPHEGLMKLLQLKISDKRFLKLIEILITPVIKEGNQISRSTCGCPQGSIISPILSNIYLHHVLDEWFETIRQNHLEGDAKQIRYADDMVFIFQKTKDAERFYKVLPKRLNKFGLSLHEEKSQLLPSGRIAAQVAHEKGERIPTYKFLGFTAYWAMARKGFWRLKFTSRKDRFSAKLKGLKNYLKQNLNTKTEIVLKTISRVIVGWMNYHHISDNTAKVTAFRKACLRILYKWFNRRGRRRPMSWKQFYCLLDSYGFPKVGKLTSMFC